MASRQLGITLAWIAVLASTAMLAVPAAAAPQRDRLGTESRSSTSVASRCSVDHAWTRVPADARLDATIAAVSTTSADTASTVSIAVPRTAVVQLDHAGLVRAAWTNTGCPPRSGDEIWIRRPDGAMSRSHDPAFVDRPWVGDFSVPGVSVSQRPG